MSEEESEQEFEDDREEPEEEDEGREVPPARLAPARAHPGSQRTLPGRPGSQFRMTNMPVAVAPGGASPNPTSVCPLLAPIFDSDRDWDSHPGESTSTIRL
jgi:hypothetical protein